MVWVERLYSLEMLRKIVSIATHNVFGKSVLSVTVSRSRRGESGGYVAAGGEGFGGMADV
jgi:hypothetical protein